MIGTSKSGRKASARAIEKMSHVRIDKMPTGDLTPKEKLRWTNRIAWQTRVYNQYQKWLPGILAKEKRMAAKSALGTKNYNVKTNTSPSTSNPAVADILGPTLYGGTGGGGDQVVPTEKVSFLSSIPTIVWIILAVGGGYFLLKKK